MLSESWKVPYFSSVVHHVFDGFLERHGFIEHQSDTWGNVVYRKGDLYFEVSYYPEDTPCYVPMVSIGFFSNKSYSAQSDRHGVGLWYILPSDAPSIDYSAWRFRNSAELLVVLKNIRDGAVRKYAVPLWEQPDHLAMLILEREASLRSEYDEIVVESARRKASTSFLAGRYMEAINEFSKIPSSLLTPLDRKKIAFAKKRLPEDMAD